MLDWFASLSSNLQTGIAGIGWLLIAWGLLWGGKRLSRSRRIVVPHTNGSYGSTPTVNGARSFSLPAAKGVQKRELDPFIGTDVLREQVSRPFVSDARKTS